MLNYIWAAMLILGIVIALFNDVSDKSKNVYRNDESFVAKFEPTESDDQNNYLMKISKDELVGFYGSGITNEVNVPVSLSIKGEEASLYFITPKGAPNVWANIAEVSGESNDIQGRVEFRKGINDSLVFGHVFLENVSFINIKNVSNAAIDYAGIAVKIALGLIGIMALWLGVMKIAEEAGLIKIIAKVVRPITRFLFPEVPHDHPAIGSIVMNISANMLGLGNAATPFGLKAMEELNKLNKHKERATNAMCMFLAVNTAGLTIIPATAIAIRAASGSNDPTIIIGTSIFGATCASITGIFSAKFFEKLSYGKEELVAWLKSFKPVHYILMLAFATLLLLTVTDTFNVITIVSSVVDGKLLIGIIQIISVIAIPAFIISFVIYGLVKKIKVYETFVEGAKEGFNVAIKIIPYLVAMLVAIGIFRAGGAMELLIFMLTPITDFIGMPAEVLPMALMRPLSGSGSIGIMTELMTTHGPDTFIGVLSSTILGSTETTFYVLAVYFGAVNIRNTRHALPVGLLADTVGILAALFIVKLMFG